MNGARSLAGADRRDTAPGCLALVGWPSRRFRPHRGASIIFAALTMVQDEPGFERIAFDIELDEAPVAICDRIRIEQAMAILLRNAVAAAATQTFPRIMIRIRSLVSLPPPRATFVEIAVKDNGGGVSPDTRGTLFEHGAGGRGEGLAQCRQIVEANGGSITCEPEDWGRTCFRITLPHA